ncbi:hypothetical protein B0J11DRAFT_519103 [Dendryphion nanum]|uniref:Uncharacterized protein n=1 Tax=Dendryphion nanum TaxID=256645 RepID=A0A9P9EEL8_9PLEO|nr:hypothetical protein B0J11DRAFT_519103 [Dendryphion nanum]
MVTMLARQAAEAIVWGVALLYTVYRSQGMWAPLSGFSTMLGRTHGGGGVKSGLWGGGQGMEQGVVVMVINGGGGGEEKKGEHE